MNEIKTTQVKSELELPKFRLGDIVQRSHRLSGADIGVFLMYGPGGAVVRGIISFYIGYHKKYPAEHQEIWPISLTKPAEVKYKDLYENLTK